MTPNVVTTVLAPATPLFKGGEPRDLCALEDVREELQLVDHAQDRWLRAQIAAESENIENYCNRIFQVQWYQDRFWPFRDSEPRKYEADLLPLQLARWPVASSTSFAGIAPPQHPQLAVIAGGSLPAARYFVRCTYVTASGETAGSMEAEISAAAGTLLQVTSPPQDRDDQAIGWNCYVGLEPNCQTLQNTDPLSIGQTFALPETALIPGPSLPDYVLVVEQGVRAPDGTTWERPLAEGVDFIVNREESQLVRLHPISRHARSWSSWPLLIQYRAGLEKVPRPVRLSAIELVKFRWFARWRDPGVRSENIEGVYSGDYWLGTGPGGPADMPASVADRLERLRVPVIA